MDFSQIIHDIEANLIYYCVVMQVQRKQKWHIMLINSMLELYMCRLKTTEAGITASVNIATKTGHAILEAGAYLLSK